MLEKASYKQPAAAKLAKNRLRDRGFDAVNEVAARMLCHLTSSSRFHGEINVDLNEIYTNLVAFPHLNFLMTAMSVRNPPPPVTLNRKCNFVIRIIHNLFYFLDVHNRK